MDDRHRVLREADVLVVGQQIVEIGANLYVPDGTLSIDASGGIVMPGMIDTHRHMWQTAMRGYGADWTLTQYFVWNYLEHGRKFRPEDIGAGNSVSAWESLEAGVTTTVDWSHNLHTPDHAEAAVDALTAVPGRFVLAYGNIQAGPWEWTADPAVRSFFERHPASDLLGLQLAFDVTGDPAFPEKAAFEAARDLGLAVTTHAGVWGATNDDGIRLMHENGFMHPETVYVHAATLSPDSGGLGLQLRGPTLEITGTPGDRVTVDTRTLAVRKPPPLAASAPGPVASRDTGGGMPWPVLLLSAPILLAALGLLVRRRRPRPPVPTIERRRHVVD